MANVERLTKRLEKMESWIEENGSGPTLNNFNWLIDVIKGNDQRMHEMDRQNNMFRELFQEYMTEKEMLEEWDTWLMEKQNAVQEQKTEEDSEKDKKE
jgi:lipase chaperone LimK